MRFSTIIGLSISAFSAVTLVTGLAVPASDIAASEFTTPGTPDSGFTIPEGTQPGLYKVTYDDNGFSHHIKIGEVSATDTLEDAGNGTSPLRTRQSAIDVQIKGWGCPGYEVNHDAANALVSALISACQWPVYIGARQHVYAFAWGLAAFDCNFESFPILCTKEELDFRFRNSLPQICGGWMAGWLYFGYPDVVHSIGIHAVDSSLNFCGISHAW